MQSAVWTERAVERHGLAHPVSGCEFNGCLCLTRFANSPGGLGLLAAIVSVNGWVDFVESVREQSLKSLPRHHEVRSFFLAADHEGCSELEPPERLHEGEPTRRPFEVPRQIAAR